jgi:hypothetical protein
VNHVREFYRVAYEKDFEIVSDQVPVAVFGVKLGRKAARVAQGFGRGPPWMTV